MWIKLYWKLLLSALLFSILILSLSSYFFGIPIPLKTPGSVIDELHGVEVHYNGSFSHVGGRNISKTGYNIGLKWQCVEFVKRYYLEVYNHEMPNSYGNAVDFYNSNLNDGDLNLERDLVQFSNPSLFKPEVGEILVFNKGYGHVAIVSQVRENSLEIIQQNVGFSSREIIKCKFENGSYLVDNKKVTGRLRKYSIR